MIHEDSVYVHPPLSVLCGRTSTTAPSSSPNKAPISPEGPAESTAGREIERPRQGSVQVCVHTRWAVRHNVCAWHLFMHVFTIRFTKKFQSIWNKYMLTAAKIYHFVSLNRACVYEPVFPLNAISSRVTISPPSDRSCPDRISSSIVSDRWVHSEWQANTWWMTGEYIVSDRWHLSPASAWP